MGWGLGRYEVRNIIKYIFKISLRKISTCGLSTHCVEFRTLRNQGNRLLDRQRRRCRAL